MATTEVRDQLDKFYDRLQTLPALVGNLGLSIAEAQRRFDQTYIESLTAFTKVVSGISSDVAPDAAAVAATAAKKVDEAGKLATSKDAAAFIVKEAGTPAPTTADGKAVLAAATAAAADPKLPPTPLDAAKFVAKAVSDTLAGLAKPSNAAQYLDLFRAIAPSHYQFTETAVEVRADLRVASESELKLGAELGIKAGMFSVAVNFSYLKRSASDYQASSALRCVINAIPADHTMLNDLFARAGTPISAPFKADASFKAVLEALNELKEIPAAPPATPPKP